MPLGGQQGCARGAAGDDRVGGVVFVNKIFTPHFLSRRNPYTAVDNISFQVAEGEILGFLGPNGAGKTTTIQMLLGVMTPTSGAIYYFGTSQSSEIDSR